MKSDPTNEVHGSDSLTRFLFFFFPSVSCKIAYTQLYGFIDDSTYFLLNCPSLNGHMP